MIEKPLTMKRQEFTEQAVELINHSGLPAFVVIGVLEALLPTLKQLEQQQLMQDRKLYEEMLDKQAEDEVMDS